MQAMPLICDRYSFVRILLVLSSDHLFILPPRLTKVAAYFGKLSEFFDTTALGWKSRVSFTRESSQSVTAKAIFAVIFIAFPSYYSE